jgi:hypothetical protein
MKKGVMMYQTCLMKTMTSGGEGGGRRVAVVEVVAVKRRKVNQGYEEEEGQQCCRVFNLGSNSGVLKSNFRHWGGSRAPTE